MSYEPPTPPAALPDDTATALQQYSPTLLEQIARYAEDLAEYKAREERLDAAADTDTPAEHPDDLPEDVPSKATITVKEINDNRYYYWQWREGDTVKSKYKGPVNPDS